MVGNTGTYVDAPAHRWADLPDLTAVPVDRLADLPVSWCGCRRASGRWTG